MRLEDFCRILEVSPSGYYAWKARQKQPSKLRSLVTEQTIVQEMKSFRQKHRFTPGIRQFHAYLQAKQLRGGLDVYVMFFAAMDSLVISEEAE